MRGWSAGGGNGEGWGRVLWGRELGWGGEQGEGRIWGAVG